MLLIVGVLYLAYLTLISKIRARPRPLAMTADADMDTILPDVQVLKADEAIATALRLILERRPCQDKARNVHDSCHTRNSCVSLDTLLLHPIEEE